MIEPTDEQVAAFKAAWEAESARTYSQPGDRYRPGDRTRAGLRAVFALSFGRRTDETVSEWYERTGNGDSAGAGR